MGKDKKPEATKENKSVEAQIREAHNSGEVVAKIAEKHNLDPNEVLYILNHEG